MIWTFPFVLGLLSLWHGGTGPDAPKTVKNIAWGVTIGGATWFLLWPYLGLGWPIITLSLMAGLISLAGKATGHGRGLGLHNPLSGMPEVLEVLTARLIPYIPAYWYKVLILAVAGFLAVGGAVLALLCAPALNSNTNLNVVIILIISGLMKGAGYMFGQWLEDKKALLRFYKMFNVRIYSNQIGEFLAGFFAGLGLLFANILM